MKLSYKPYNERKFKLYNQGFEKWVYMKNRGIKEYYDEKTKKFVVKKWDLYPYSCYRYKRFLVQYIAAIEKNSNIPSGAKDLYQKYYNIFQKPYIGEAI